MKTTSKRPTFEEVMEPTIIVCAQCGGKLHIIPIKVPVGKNRFKIETINICGKCTFRPKEVDLTDPLVGVV